MTTLVYQILHEDPMKDVPIPAAVSADLADFLRWTMAKDREQRVPDARTFASKARSISRSIRADSLLARLSPSAARGISSSLLMPVAQNEGPRSAWQA